MKKVLLFFLPFLFGLLLFVNQDKSFMQDLGRHIKMGEIIWQTHTVPAVNLFSYTEPLHEFINHHWGSEVIFYLFYTFLGVNSLILLKIFLILLSFGLVYSLAFRKSPFWAICGAFFYLYIFSYRFDIRPELFSFLFISLFIFLSLKYQESKNLKYIFILPLIELLWVNMHIYFVIGIILFAFLIFAEFLKSKKIDSKLLLLFFVTVLATLANPAGIRGAQEPLTILQNYGYSIVENQSVFFLNQFFFNPQILMFEITAVALVITGLFNLKRANVFLLTSSLIAIVLGFKMVRNFPIFVLVSFPLLVYFLSESEKKIKNQLLLKQIAGTVVCFFIVLTVYGSFTSPLFGFSYVHGAEKGVDYLEKNKLKGPIFNNFDIGSYLIFRLYPREKVFVDGRPEAYSVRFFDDYKRMQSEPIFFEQQVKKYKIQTIFFTHTDMTPWARQFLYDISKNKTWERVYLDDRIIILTKI